MLWRATTEFAAAIQNEVVYADARFIPLRTRFTPLDYWWERCRRWGILVSALVNCDTLTGTTSSRPHLRDEWLSFIDRTLFRYKVPPEAPRDAQFEVNARSRSANGFTLARFTTMCRQSQLFREPSQIARDSQDRYVLYLSMRGSLEFAQLGRVRQCQPHAMALLTAAEPIVHTKLGNNDTICFLMPRHFIDSRVTAGYDRCLRDLRVDRGLGAVAKTALVTLDEQMTSMSDMEFQYGVNLLADLMTAVIAGCNDAMTAERSARAANLARVKRYIKQSISDPELSVAKISVTCGISVSYLHALFKGEDFTVCDYMRIERLQRARQLLAIASAANRPSITEIALSCGFSNMSHFSTAFKKAFGHSPSAVRFR